MQWRKITRLLRWDGFSFLFLAPFAIGLLAMDEFTAAKLFFWLSSGVLWARISYEASRHYASRKKIVIIVAGMACALVGLYQWTMVAWVNRRADKRPENPIVEWGTSPAGTKGGVYVRVNTKGLEEYRQKFQLVVICRVQDNSVESKDDTRIEKSNPFEITGEAKLVTLTLSQPLMRRLVPRGVVQVYLLLVPKSVSPSEITSVNGIISQGAILLGARAMLVHALVEQP